MDKNNVLDSLVEQRDATLILFNGSRNPIKSKGLFLNPTSVHSSNAFPNSNFTFSRKLKKPNYQRNFRWWPDPHLHWDTWINKLEPKYAQLWQKVGIFDAIMSSKYKFKKEPNIILGVSRYWCDKTNTFIFPWGEATVTLEDVMILGGFPVLGEPVKLNYELDGELGHMESILIKKLSKSSRANRTSKQFSWMKLYMNSCSNVDERDEIEHAAFLTYWLSRFVLPSTKNTIKSNVVQVAVRLAKGRKVALAPAVLASIYKSLSIVKDHISSETCNTTPLAILAPMNILQFWVWERFSPLSPSVKILTSFHMPRIARWVPKQKQSALTNVMQTIESPNEFTWRPYVKDLINWRKPSFYVNDGQWLFSGETRDEGLRSFAQFLKVSELVGLDCIEQYQPHRVARQFGLSQDLPCFVPRDCLTWKDAWESYDIRLKNVSYYIPSRFFTPCVSLEYSQWWKRWEDVGDGKKRKLDDPLCDSGKKRKFKSLHEIAEVEDSEVVDEKQSEVANASEEKELEKADEKIVKLKIEIAYIVAKIKQLESEAEANSGFRIASSSS